ncbi:Amino Acid/Auxin Permease (AAAP) Family [Phytophthora infestans T30-4]|uniref:Amino Acid/Auxin Permease (AAAP) Family n=1 Tax=Phytophthora infestans (strain T30-4) TaxID=403677 RepID=D0N168_PHYIT|nr:Amino Acid/Auxin Permease (AAAP) Family [Phytophthora infestans T30-4]EEY67381.1 Amino Acid/Auxin Permease (AAAP) Family [Phytophthora infestans T30-4]|eukprot:XP_002906029.1 Amino Acid/Auxin Permease (AAAP) Family [Phytophthora infestans T30-4]
MMASVFSLPVLGLEYQRDKTPLQPLDGGLASSIMPFFTLEGFKISFSFFCTVYGIGTLGLPANFARSGAPIATVALLFMGFANVCSCVAISRVCLAAPEHLKTYGDVGEWCCGKIGRYLVLLAQFGVCLLVPCAYLVLGGILLDGISPGAFDQQYWSIIMAAMLLPVIVTPTLKEGAYAAFAGCLGTVLADAIAIAVLAVGIGNDHPSVPHPDIKFSEAASSFGNLALAYSAAVLVPALQREHSQPERMPRVIACTMIFAACCFLIIGETSYSYVGCQIPGNLLFAVNGTAAVVLAYMFMQLHITIAMSVILNPVLYIL